MTFGDGKTYKQVWLELGDDGSEPAHVIAEQLGCSEATVRKYRFWRETQEFIANRRRCSHCTFYEDDERPIITPEREAVLAEVVGGELRGVPEGLCLWCWLAAQGIDYHAFYASGAWQSVVEWRPPEPEPRKALQDAVKERMRAQMQTYRGVADQCGIRRLTMWQFVDGDDVVLTSEDVEALCAYADVDASMYVNALVD